LHSPRLRAERAVAEHSNRHPAPIWRQRWLAAAGILILACLCSCSASPGRGDQPSEASVPDRQIMLMLPVPTSKPSGPWDDAPSGYAASRARTLALRTAQALALEYHLRIVDNWAMPALGVHCIVARIESSADSEAVLRSLNTDRRIAWAQPLQRYRTLGEPTALAGIAASDGWSELPALHGIAVGRGVTVAQVDTGVDLKHRALAGHWFGPRDYVGLGGFNEELHGTAVAGLIVAHASGRAGAVGVAPGARLMPLRACRQVDAGIAECTSFTLAKALQHALQEHVQIVNLSLTGPDDALLAKLIDRGLEQGVVVVAAADESPRGPGFPAQHPGVIAAAGSRLPALPQAVLAPSVDVLTTIPNSAFGFMSGSSFAAAQVTGLTALLLELSPHLTPARVHAVLVQAAASGAVDPCAALLAVMPGGRAPTCSRGAGAPALHQAGVH
jgi:hypothetical protein